MSIEDFLSGFLASRRGPWRSRGPSRARSARTPTPIRRTSRSTSARCTRQGTSGRGDPPRARLGLVKVITGATHTELLVAYQALDQRQPEYPKAHGQRISVRCGGRVVIDTE